MGSEHKLSSMGIGLGILEDLDQPGRETGMKTRVDFIEQKNLTESESRDRRTDQTEPGLRAGGFILQVESNRFPLAAVNEAKARSRPRRAP